jgi:hypothetical protein
MNRSVTCKCIFKKQSVKSGLDSSGSRKGPVASFCGQGNEFPYPIKCGKFCDQLNNYRLLNKNSVPWG